MPISAEIVRSLHPYDIRILLLLERLMKQYRWVPDDILRKEAGVSAKELDYRLGRLTSMDLARSSSVPYRGYQLVFAGYDALALLELVRRGTVQALGPPLGEGKESVVFAGLGLSDVVLKFHRLGQRSFSAVRKARTYLPEYRHFPWIFASSRSARAEYEALTRLSPHVRVPLPIDQNRNVVVMSLIPGVTMNACRLEHPVDVLAMILEDVGVAYGLGVIHGDLSEFNVMVDADSCWIIDWPQWISPDHPNAGEILARDVRNILDHFSRKYGISRDLSEVLAEVTG